MARAVSRAGRPRTKQDIQSAPRCRKVARVGGDPQGIRRVGRPVRRSSEVRRLRGRVAEYQSQPCAAHSCKHRGACQESCGPLLRGDGDGRRAALHVRSWVARLQSQGLARQTVKGAFLTVSQVFASAVVDGVVARTPCIGIDFGIERERDEVHFLTAEQVGDLAAAITPRYRVAVLTAAYEGLRAGELWALKARRVSELTRTIDVVESAFEVGGVRAEGPTKTGKVRTIGLPSFLAAEIKTHLDEYGTSDAGPLHVSGGSTRPTPQLRHAPFPARGERGRASGGRPLARPPTHMRGAAHSGRAASRRSPRPARPLNDPCHFRHIRPSVSAGTPGSRRCTRHDLLGSPALGLSRVDTCTTFRADG